MFFLSVLQSQYHQKGVIQLALDGRTEYIRLIRIHICDALKQSISFLFTCAKFSKICSMEEKSLSSRGFSNCQFSYYQIITKRIP